MPTIVVILLTFPPQKRILLTQLAFTTLLMKKLLFAVPALLLAGLIACKSESEKRSYGSREWKEYLGGPERNHYSPLEQITKENVSKLKIAWEYHTQDSGQIQCNPIIVDGVLYGMTATTRPFALDAATGKEIWRVAKDTVDSYSTSRGVAYWEDGDDKRILYTKGAWLYALDARDLFPDPGNIHFQARDLLSQFIMHFTRNTFLFFFTDMLQMRSKLPQLFM